MPPPALAPLSHLALHLDIDGCIGPASYTAHTHWSVSFIWTFFSVRTSPLSPQASTGAECLKSARNAPGHQLVEGCFPLGQSITQEEGPKSNIWSVHFFVYSSLQKQWVRFLNVTPLVWQKQKQPYMDTELTYYPRPNNQILKQRSTFTLKFSSDGSFPSEQTKKLDY